MKYQQVGEEILVIEDLLTNGVKVGTVGTHYCSAKKLVIEGDNSPLTIKLLTWEDVQTTDNIEVTVNTNGIISTAQLISGQGEFVFEQATPGQYVITVIASNIDIGTKIITVI